MVREFEATKRIHEKPEHSNLNDVLYNEMEENGYANLHASWQDEGTGVTEAWGVTKDDVNWVGTVSGSANGIDLCWTQEDYPCPDDPTCTYVLKNCDASLYDINVAVKGVITSLSWIRTEYVGNNYESTIIYECKATINYSAKNSESTWT